MTPHGADPAQPAVASGISHPREAWCHQVCLSLPDATADQPFGPVSWVFRIRGRMFALLTQVPKISSHPLINLKATPSEVPLLIRDHDLLMPGWHMNKKHWISVVLAPEIDLDLARDLIEESYDHVVAKLPRSRRPLGARLPVVRRHD